MAARQDASHPHGNISISRMERRSIVSLVAEAPSAVGAATVGLGALFHLCRDHPVLNFGEDLLVGLPPRLRQTVKTQFAVR